MPAIVAVPSPLSVKVRPPGRLPVRAIAGVGEPAASTLKLPATPVVSVVVVPLPKLGAIPATFTFAVAGALVWVPLETTRVKVRFAGPTGAVKVGLAVLEPLRVTAGPPVWIQAYCSGRPFGSQLSEPSRVTAAEEATCCSGPASAAGVGSLPGT